MKSIIRNSKGFTLIELMIVVAIIGILAAIAIPQFAQYRMRAFNTSAESDLRNLKTAQEVLMGDHQHYGVTAEGSLQPTTVPTAATLDGPKNAATADKSGATVVGNHPTTSKIHAIGFGVGNSVSIKATADSQFSAFNAYSHHFQGNRIFGTEGDSTAIMYCQGEGSGKSFVGQTGECATIGKCPASPTQTEIQITESTDCGGDIVSKWTAM